MWWPETADGDVFRRLERSGFDFDAEWLVDYDIDFTTWPPASNAIALLRKDFPDLSIYEPEGSSSGYVQVREFGRLSYDRVIEVQQILSNAMTPFGGICEAWGVLH